MLQLADDVQFQLSQPSPATQTDILETEFDLLILDADAQDFDSVEILRGIKKRSPEKKVLFVCEKLGRTVLHAYRSGLDGCFSKKENTSEIIAALGAVLGGKVHVPQSIIMNILCDGFVFTDFDTKLGQLSKRELDVLEHIASGRKS